jgi:hypothetical protein
MCCFDYDGQWLLGDLKVQTIKEIFNSEAFLNLEESHMTGNFNNDIICNICDQRIEYDGMKTWDEDDNYVDIGFDAKTYDGNIPEDVDSEFQRVADILGFTEFERDRNDKWGVRFWFN